MDLFLLMLVWTIVLVLVVLISLYLIIKLLNFFYTKIFKGYFDSDEEY
jgi:biopolymer transport protein ExbB/TolQ